MSFVKYAVPALAVAGQALGQCSVAATTTIQNQGDASGIAGCTTFTGSIALATSTANDISFNNLQEITGDLDATNAVALTSISGPSLTTIGGTWHLQNLTVLDALNFPRLTDVGNIDWETLPILQGLQFTTGLTTTNNLSITDTELQNLAGINLASAGSISISENRYLTDINMQLVNVTGDITISTNNNGETNVVFADLMHAGSLLISQVATLSLPSLQYVNNTFNVNANTFTSLACPNLTTAGELYIANNRNLANISFPELTTVGTGGINVITNAALTDVISFPALTKDNGAFIIVGGFSGVTIPDIKSIVGASNLTSTANIQSTCNTFTGTGTGQLGGSVNGVIQGKNTCSGSVASTTSSNSTTSSSGTPKNAAGRTASAATSLVAGFALVAALFSLC